MLPKRSLLFFLLFAAVSLLVWGGDSEEKLSFAKKQLHPGGGAKAEIVADAIVLEFDNPKAGLKITPPEGQGVWDWSKRKYLAAEVENTAGGTQLRLNMQLTSKGDKNRDVVIGIALNPGEKRTLRLGLPHRALNLSPEGVPGPRHIDSDKIIALDFNLQWPFEKAKKELVKCKVSNARLEGEAGNLAAKAEEYYPFVDAYGQYVHQDWPEKIHSDKDLKNALAKEQSALAASKRPESWNRFGGWKDGPTLAATGYFRTEKYQDKWFLVDPEGKLFFSHGLDVLYAHTDATSTKDHEKWFAAKDIKGDRLAFTDSNLKIKYGKDDYAPEFYDTLGKRMQAWGINSIGDWANGDFIALGTMPYTLQISDFKDKLPRIGNSKLKLNDVFDPKYVQRMKTLIPDEAKNNPFLLKSLTDPLCIGYFIDNELRFGNWNHEYRNALVEDVIKSPATQAAKNEFIGDLKLNYLTVEKLNAAWKTTYPDWDALLESTTFPPKSAAFEQDQKAFFTKMVRQYFRLCRDAIKTVAPHRLYLGCRFLSTECSERVVSEASKEFCDVLTVNIYAHTPANFPSVAEGFVDMPVLIGEFHLGILDRGMFAPGLCLAGTTQEERATAYTRFLQGALVHPNIVGAHWFQFRDQPLTGRWDGEGYAVGFVDVADTPYPEMSAAARAIGENMYTYRLRGKLANELK